MKGYLLLISLLFYVSSTANLGDASRLNKHIYKSIKSEDGDVIDCLDISNAGQPAFDHPKLKNHTIKVCMYNAELSSRGIGEAALAKLYSINGIEITQLWQRSGECPEGTISTRRTAKPANLSIKKSLPSRHGHGHGLASNRTQDTDTRYSHEYVVTYAADGEYYGTKAIISAWQPYVEGSNEFSLSQLWLVGGSDSDTNTIEVGWTVNPAVFGDLRTRLFVFWTADNYAKTGCWNLGCSGFVQISNKVAIGAAIDSASDSHPEVTLLVWKDKDQGVWWFQYNNEVIAGYWPADIFTNLNTDSASYIEWGGEIINSHKNGRHTATQMGSGQFAQTGRGKASYFRNLEVVDSSNYLRQPASINAIVTNSKCYSIAVGKGKASGYYFYYGGPGRNPNCP